jgi:hypothetical protein
MYYVLMIYVSLTVNVEILSEKKKGDLTVVSPLVEYYSDTSANE